MKDDRYLIIVYEHRKKRGQTPNKIVSEQYYTLVWIFVICLSNAAMQCIGQTYTITLGMVSDGDVWWRCPMAMAMSGNVWE